MQATFAFFLVTALASFWTADGAVSFAEIKKDYLEEYDKEVLYCEYKGLRLLPWSRVQDYDTCMRCICRKSGLSCESIGITFTVPDDSKCVPVNIGCRTRWRFRNNLKRWCPKSLRPTNISAVGKK